VKLQLCSHWARRSLAEEPHKKQRFINNSAHRNQRFNKYTNCGKFDNCGLIYGGTTDKMLLVKYINVSLAQVVMKAASHHRPLYVPPKLDTIHGANA